MCKAGREEEELSRLGVLCFVTGPGDLQKEVSRDSFCGFVVVAFELVCLSASRLSQDTGAGNENSACPEKHVWPLPCLTPDSYSPWLIV